MSMWFDVVVVAILSTLFLTPYGFYRWLLLLLRHYQPEVQPPSAATDQPTVSVLVPAHNEAARIVAKLENLLALDYPKHKLQILVACDGSSDGTARLARRFTAEGVVVHELARRGGKVRALQELLAHATGDLVMFTDVSAKMPADALARLVTGFAPGVGAVVPRYSSNDSVAESTRERSEAAYWRAETGLKGLESACGVLFGAHGACYLARRALLVRLPDDTMHDDLAWPLAIRASGARVVYRPEIVIRETSPSTLSTTFHRTARIAQGNLQLLWRSRTLLHPSHGRLALGLICHKLLKTLGPVWLALGYWYVQVRRHELPMLAHLALAVVLWTLLCVAWSWSSRRGSPLPVAAIAHAAVAQAACAYGILRYFIGAETVRWKRAPENEPLDLSVPAQPPWSVLAAKRTLDLLGSLLALMLLWPIMLMIALAIRVESSGPVIYRQRRLAYGTDAQPQPFMMWKFRSMRTDAEADGRAVWAQRNDTRVTRVGALLRRTRLDELPQLFQVVLGQMSLVGPRPERPEIADSLSEALPGYSDRLLPCKPGITGWAQIHTGYDVTIDSVREKLLYDFTYNAHLYNVRDYLAMEVKVVFKTVSVMVFGRGAH